MLRRSVDLLGDTLAFRSDAYPYSQQTENLIEFQDHEDAFMPLSFLRNFMEIGIIGTGNIGFTSPLTPELCEAFNTDFAHDFSIEGASVRQKQLLVDLVVGDSEFRALAVP